MHLVTGRKMISSDNIPLAPEELITALYLAVSVMLAWVQNTGKRKGCAFTRNILFPLGKSEHDSMSGKEIFHTDKENEHLPTSFNS